MTTHSWPLMKRPRLLVLTLAAVLSLAGGLLPAAPSSSRSSPLKIDGDVIVVVRSLPCRVVAPEGADFYQWSFPDTIKAAASDSVLSISAAPKGTHKVTVLMVTVEIDFEKKSKRIRKESAEIEVTVGEQPKPPEPLPPKDPLVESLRAAYAAETSPEKAKHLEALASLYRQAAKLDLGPVKTSGELYQKLTAASRALLPADALPAVRKVVGAELKAVLPSTTDAELSTETKQRVLSLFGRLGDALTEAGK